jgi:uncharacterized RDD family membrane protein YckC
MPSSQTPPPTPSFARPPKRSGPFRYSSNLTRASTRSRFWATVIDLFVCHLLIALAFGVDSKLWKLLLESNLLLLAPVYVIYLIVTETVLDGSIGKRFMKLKVRMRDSDRIPLKLQVLRAIIKNFEMFIWLPLAYLFVLITSFWFSSTKEGWDIITFHYKNNRDRSLADIKTKSDVYVRKSRWRRER